MGTENREIIISKMILLNKFLPILDTCNMILVIVTLRKTNYNLEVYVAQIIAVPRNSDTIVIGNYFHNVHKVRNLGKTFYYFF